FWIARHAAGSLPGSLTTISASSTGGSPVCSEPFRPSPVSVQHYFRLRFSAPLLTFISMMSLRDVGTNTPPDCRRSCADRKVLVRRAAILFHFFVAALALLIPFSAEGQTESASLKSKPNSTMTHELGGLAMPRLNAAPKLSDFAGMEPATPLARQMLKVGSFTQKEPHDGAPVSEPTEAYLGYTDKNFYAVFLAFDKEPHKIRARMLRRELIDDDDQCGLWLDTFHDHRHAYMFYSNAYGIQQDGLMAENQGFDNSFDTVWHTYTKMTGSGYMVIFEIPFKSLR